MKKIHLAPYCFILTVGNCFTPLILRSVAYLMRGTYHHILGDLSLGRETEIALALPVWFFIFTGCFALAFAGLWVPKLSLSWLAHWLLSACIIECAALLYFAWY